MKNVNAPKIDSILQLASQARGVEITGSTREERREQFRLARKVKNKAEGTALDNQKKYHLG
ncbi:MULTISPECIES: hypothetical protein [Erwiniaceae]|uniref:Uncharacterized protein n=1 Tax=Enterobacter agglomerans TaxID=549 RepID=A0ACC5RG78_ENTAG|nr:MULTISPECIES: hypothetical protein [Erwiniaceae]MBK4723706.1 hypothetical protein [Pantoea agglomerans]MBP2155198.1 hypothetical protein [Erwinia rhapontici]TDS99837.1 hypothetical protein EDF84_103139 [Erwinia rhapontici]